MACSINAATSSIAHCSQAHSGYEAALDPWLQELFATLQRLQQAEPSLFPTLPVASSAAPVASSAAPSQCSGSFVVSVVPGRADDSVPRSSAGGAATGAALNGKRADAADRGQSGAQPSPRRSPNLQRFREACAAAAAFRRLDAAASGCQDAAARPPPADAGAAPAANCAAPEWAAVVVTRRLTAPEHWQTVQHIELESSGARLAYEPGDLATIWPFVAPERAEAFLKRLRIPLGAPWILLNVRLRKLAPLRETSVSLPAGGAA